MRENPNLEAEVFGMLEQDTAVEVLDKSAFAMKIGDQYDYWYKVRGGGIEG